MYDLEDLVEPYKVIYEEVLFDKKCEPFGITLGSISLIFSVIILFIRVVLYKLGICAELDYDLFWEISFWIAESLVFYPATFTIIYTPIALLLAIPVVLYKHVFKLG